MASSADCRVGQALVTSQLSADAARHISSRRGWESINLRSDFLYQWIGLREHLQETIDFPMISMGFSCKFSLHPIHFFTALFFPFLPRLYSDCSCRAEEAWLYRAKLWTGKDLTLLCKNGRWTTGWCPPVISWFINPINYSYIYHKP